MTEHSGDSWSTDPAVTQWLSAPDPLGAATDTEGAVAGDAVSAGLGGEDITGNSHAVSKRVGSSSTTEDWPAANDATAQGPGYWPSTDGQDPLRGHELGPGPAVAMPEPQGVTVPAGRIPVGQWVRAHRLVVGAVTVVVIGLVVAVVVSALHGNGSSPSTASAPTPAPPTSAATAAAPDCPSQTEGAVTTGRDAGDTSSGPGVIKAFEYAYYVRRDGAAARSLVTPTATFSTAAQIQAGIDSKLDPATIHCVTITDRGTGLYAVAITEIPPNGELPQTHHQLIQTTTTSGRTWIVSIIKDPAAQ